MRTLAEERSAAQDFAATALELGVPLVTADKGFQKIAELDLWLLVPNAL